MARGENALRGFQSVVRAVPQDASHEERYNRSVRFRHSKLKSPSRYRPLPTPMAIFRPTIRLGVSPSNAVAFAVNAIGEPIHIPLTDSMFTAVEIDRNRRGAVVDLARSKKFIRRGQHMPRQRHPDPVAHDRKPASAQHAFADRESLGGTGKRIESVRGSTRCMSSRRCRVDVPQVFKH